jgi:hypothetical protein
MSDEPHQQGQAEADSNGGDQSDAVGHNLIKREGASFTIVAAVSID